METAKARLLRMTEFDADITQGARFVAGMDEAGRGPIAGPVVAACVLVDPNAPIEGVNDSKKLSETRRKSLCTRICASAIAYGVGFATVAEIERDNILRATHTAMRRAVDGMEAVLFHRGRKERYVLLCDYAAKLPIEAVLITHGDAQSYAIAAASIIAKVTRDCYMCALDAICPGYGFSAHKGYGTAAHIAAIRSLGPSMHHRASFLGTILANGK